MSLNRRAAVTARPAAPDVHPDMTIIDQIFDICDILAEALNEVVIYAGDIRDLVCRHGAGAMNTAIVEQEDVEEQTTSRIQERMAV